MRRQLKSKRLGSVSTEQIENLIETLMWFWGNIHQRWRVAVEEEYGLDAVRQLELKLGDVGKSHAKRIKKIFKVGKGVTGFNKAFQYTPEKFLEPFEIEEQTEKLLIISNPSCSIQKARVKRGKSEFPCKETATLYMAGFAHEIDPNIKLSCIVCPPDDHPNNCFCKWRLEVK